MIIGLDGTRAEGIDIAETQNLNVLRSTGYTDLDSLTNDISLSGPGWSSMLTGVWCDKHRVLDNDVSWANSQFDQFPHFFWRVNAFNPTLKLVSITHWAPINDEILCSKKSGRDCTKIAKVINETSDVAVKNSAVNVLRQEDPHAVFLQFDDIDHAGHGGGVDLGGFCPKPTGEIDGACTARGTNKNYLAEIKRIDGYIGEILAALKSRQNFEAENWLILVSPDHGGGGQVFNQHGFPAAQDRRTFVIMNGPSARSLPGKPAQKLEDLPSSINNNLPSIDTTGIKIVDLAATALYHLGVPVLSQWNLDGQPTGIVGSPNYIEKATPSCIQGIAPLITANR